MRPLKLSGGEPQDVRPCLPGDDLTALDLIDLRQKLESQARRSKALQYAMLSVIFLLAGVLLAVLTTSTLLPGPTVQGAPPLLTAEDRRAILDATYDDEGLPLIVRGAASVNRACSTVLLCALLTSAFLVSDLSAIATAAREFPHDVLKVLALYASSPWLASTLDGPCKFDSLMPGGWKFGNCVSSATRLKGLTTMFIGGLLLFSASCFWASNLSQQAVVHASVFRAYRAGTTATTSSGPSL